MDGNAAYWLALSKVAGIGPARMRLLLEQFGDARSAWNANLSELLAAGLDARAAASLLNLRRSFDFEAELRKLDAAGVDARTPEVPRGRNRAWPLLALLMALSVLLMCLLAAMTLPEGSPLHGTFFGASPWADRKQPAGYHRPPGPNLYAQPNLHTEPDLHT